MPDFFSRPEVRKVGLHVVNPQTRQLVIAFKAYDLLDGFGLGQRVARMPEFSGCMTVLCARASDVHYLPGSMVRAGASAQQGA